MKVLVISDSHGNIANLKAAMEIGRKAKVEAIIHCGDWDNVKSVETVLSYSIPLYTVLGNADIQPDEENLLISEAEGYEQKFLSFKLDNKKIGVIHNIREPILAIHTLDIVFYGHTQKQKESQKEGARIVNPGALEHGINFAIYDTETDKVEFINE